MLPENYRETEVDGATKMTGTTVRVSDATYKLIIQCRGIIEHENGERLSFDMTIARVLSKFRSDNSLREEKLKGLQK